MLVCWILRLTDKVCITLPIHAAKSNILLFNCSKLMMFAHFSKVTGWFQTIYAMRCVHHYMFSIHLILLGQYFIIPRIKVYVCMFPIEGQENMYPFFRELAVFNLNHPEIKWFLSVLWTLLKRGNSIYQGNGQCNFFFILL